MLKLPRADEIANAKDMLDIMKEAASTTAVTTTSPTNGLTIDDRCIEVWDSFRQNQNSLDVTISDKDGNEKCRANSAFLASASPVLKAMLLGEFAEGAAKTISVDEALAPGTLDLFLELLYCGSACDNPNRTYKSFLDALSLSHRWEVPYVCDICRRHLSTIVKIENVEAIAEAGTRFGFKDMEEAAIKFTRHDSEMKDKMKEGKLGPALTRLMFPDEHAEQPKKKRRCIR